MAAKKKEPENFGIELDQLEIPPLPTTARAAPKRRPAERSRVKTTPELPAEPKQRTWLKLSIIIGVLLFAGMSILFYEREELLFLFRTNQTSNLPSQYFRVGPLSATTANNDLVKVTLDIACKNKKLKNKVSKMDSLIQDQIVRVLSRPETQQLLQANDFNTLQANLRMELNTLFPEQAIDDIYFSEFLTY